MIKILFFALLLFFSCNSTRNNYSGDNCNWEEDFYNKVFNSQLEYFYKSQSTYDTLNELFVCSNIVRYKEMGKVKVANFFDCFANAEYIKSVEYYDKDTLHTLGCYKIDNLFVSYKYERNKKFQYKIEIQDFFNTFLENASTPALITEIQRIGKKRWKVNVLIK